MDTLTASAVMQRQDSYAAPPNYIGPPGRCQRIDDCRLLIVDWKRVLRTMDSSLRLHPKRSEESRFASRRIADESITAGFLAPLGITPALISSGRWQPESPIHRPWSIDNRPSITRRA
jgi:hypothetical protein